MHSALVRSRSTRRTGVLYRAIRPSTHRRVAIAFEHLELRRMLSAMTYTVTTINDVIDPNDGKLSLREAIIAANLNSGEDTVRLANEKYYLRIEGANENLCRTGDLDVLGDLKIQGASGNNKQSTIDAGMLQQRDRVLNLLSSKVCIDNVTISGGQEQFGGGILALGKPLTITKSNFCNNKATDQTVAAGGAIATLGASLDVCDTKFKDNCASALFAAGGGIASALSDKIKLSRVTFDSNKATGAVALGGGIATAIIGLEVADIEALLANNASGIAAMRAKSGNNNSACAAVTIDCTTFKCNTATGAVGSGGGAFLLLSNANVTGSKFDTNTASGNSELGGIGGGMSVILSKLNIDNTCFTCNAAIGGGRDSLALGGGLSFLLGLSNLTTLINAPSSCNWLDLNVTNSSFSNNTARIEDLTTSAGHSGNPGGTDFGGVAAGGGAFVALAWAKFSCNVQFCNNSAKGLLAGIGGGMATLIVSLEVNDSKFSNNCANGLIAAGGGLATAISDRVKLKNDCFECNSVTGFLAVGGGFAAAVVGLTVETAESLMAGDTNAVNSMRAKSGTNNNACGGITIDCGTFKNNKACGGIGAGGGAFLLLTNTSIKGTRFEGNNATGESEIGAHGGGVSAILSKLTIDGACFTCNSAVGKGDAVVALGGGLEFLLGLSSLVTLVNAPPVISVLDLDVKNTTFSNNTAETKAGVITQAGHGFAPGSIEIAGITAGGGAFVAAATARFSCNVQFCNNQAKGILAGLGGGMATLIASLEVTDSKFTNNTACGLIAAGGGLATAISDRVKLKNDCFECNSVNGLVAVGGGFAAAVVGLTQVEMANLIDGNDAGGNAMRGRSGQSNNCCGALTVDCCTFKNNKASGVLAAGGGAFLLLVTGKVSNTRFEGNSACGDLFAAGGGLYAALSTLCIDCCTFTCNNATAKGITTVQAAGTLGFFGKPNALGGGLAFQYGLGSLTAVNPSSTSTTNYDLTITNTTFCNNLVKAGSGPLQAADAAPVGNIIVGGDGMGGGAYVNFASVYITGSHFTNNTAQGGDGTGISTTTEGPGVDPWAGDGIGGGLALDVVYARVTCSDFCGNVAKGGNALPNPANAAPTPIPPLAGAGRGGGIAVLGGNTQACFDRITVKDNQALGGKWKQGNNWVYAGPGEGGGIYVDVGRILLSSPPTDGSTPPPNGNSSAADADVKILNSCITNNCANGLLGRGGGLFIQHGRVFWDNATQIRNNKASSNIGNDVFDNTI